MRFPRAVFYAWRDRPLSLRAQENARLEIEIRAAHQRTRETCGPERLQSDLADHGIRAGVDRIKRIRKKLGLRCKQKRKFKVTTDSRHNLPVAPNLLNRNFTVTSPSRAWVSDEFLLAATAQNLRRMAKWLAPTTAYAFTGLIALN